VVTPHGHSIPATTSSGTSLMLSPHVGVSQLQTGTATDVVVPAGPERDPWRRSLSYSQELYHVGQFNMGGCTPSAINKALPAAS
jgi:hypothetical protein